jgi:hypothetical protein
MAVVQELQTRDMQLFVAAGVHAKQARGRGACTVAAMPYVMHMQF